jgi:hypothetical protein
MCVEWSHWAADSEQGVAWAAEVIFQVQTILIMCAEQVLNYSEKINK